ncbi:hypothetical protein [Dactylosporangium fulvum]|uniref:Uncharacterized protein n=1 Tax=Dactylosporangium fulvum TaxID=53359 RepID=A0ABY5VSM1_9ACTN|nr:hypothetical protein [Dactylosporangium fulvum]UWP80089.1 hypothetical protein Dfulv_33675 [Dactylosporangium fulvum]
MPVRWNPRRANFKAWPSVATMPSRSTTAEHRPSQAVEDDVKAIYALRERGVAVTTTALAEVLSIELEP